MKAEEALDFVPVEKREFITMVTPANPKKLKEMKEKIRTFYEDLRDQFNDGNATEVFQISMQVFPLTIDEEEK